MANTLSDLLTNLLSSPRTLNRAGTGHGKVYFQLAQVAVAAADNDGRIYPMFRVKANWRVIDLIVGNDAITGGTDYDFGIYTAVDWNAADGAVKDANIYADGVTMATARSVAVATAAAAGAESTGSMRDVLGVSFAGSTSITGLQWGRMVWEDAGLTTAPTDNTEYDLCWTANTVGTGAGTIRCGLLYVAAT